MSIELDVKQWPICFVKIDGDPTLTEYEGYIAAFNRLYERREPFAVVSYVKRYSANPQIVRRTGTWFKETEPLIKQYWRSNAIVSSSTGFRFILSAVYLIKPLPIANKVCATADEAMAFTRATWSGKLPPLSWPF